MKKWINRIVLVFVAVVTFTGVLGCAKDAPAPQPPSPRTLVESDLRALKSVDSLTLHKFDKSNRNLFTKIFGGASADDLANFIATRIRYFHTEAEWRRMITVPQNFTYNDWGKDDTNEARTTPRAELGAANYGMALWLSGIVDKVPVSLVREGKSLPVESSRFGLMLIGPGYKPSKPSAHRLGILIHEARHSDCTGGITEDDVQVLRKSSSARHTDLTYTNQACGHLHTYCPPGHDLSDLLACDKHPWGAYAIQLVYLRAVLPSLNAADKAALEASEVDAKSRLLYDVDGLMAERMGEPDMTSSGYRRR
jgi:hypothetical protein